MDKEYYYRYTEIRYSLGLDFYDEPLPGYRLGIVLESYEVSHYTPKGVWIFMESSIFALNEEDRQKRFILLSAKKKFAHKTKEEALESFIERKKAQIGILKQQLDMAEAALNIAQCSTVQDIESTTRTMSHGKFIQGDEC